LKIQEDIDLDTWKAMIKVLSNTAHMVTNERLLSMLEVAKENDAKEIIEICENEINRRKVDSKPLN
jgi:N-acyl-L-homoserine lactone synthetase